MLKILHTSDWHIGQRIHGVDRTDEFKMLFDYTCNLIEEEGIEVLLISGDVFDVGYPSNASLRLYYEFLLQLSHTCCQKVVVTGGNHDQTTTLEAPKDILAMLNVEVIGAIPDAVEDVVVRYLSKTGEQVNIAAVPFLRPKDIRTIGKGESYEDSVTATREGISNYYKEVGTYMETLPGVNLAMGHLFIMGSEQSESERDIHIGNLSNITTDIFPNTFRYVALGHIHRPKVFQDGRVTYCGSPIPLSFSEREDKKLMRIVEVTEDKLSCRSVELPLFSAMKAFKGSLEQVKQSLSVYKHSGVLVDKAEVDLVELSRTPKLLQGLQELSEEYGVNHPEIQILKIKITLEEEPVSARELFEAQESLKELKASDVFSRLLDRKGVDDADVRHTFQELLEQVEGQS